MDFIINLFFLFLEIPYIIMNSFVKEFFIEEKKDIYCDPYKEFIKYVN